MLYAKLITEANREFITNENDGVTPAEECFDGKHVFMYSDSAEIPNDIVTIDEFEKSFRFNDRTPNDNSVSEI